MYREIGGGEGYYDSYMPWICRNSPLTSLHDRLPVEVVPFSGTNRNILKIVIRDFIVPHFSSL